MSSSCHSVVPRALLAVGALLALGQASSVLAQQIYFVPAVQVSAEANTNRRLDPVDDRRSEGYKARFEGTWKRVTPTGLMEIRPQLTYQDYPQFKGTERLEEGLDLNLEHKTQKGFFSLLGRYQRQDTLNAEFGRAAFDPTLPEDGTDNDPGSAGSGLVTGGIVRTTYWVEPQFAYSLTRLTDLETDVRLIKVKYDTDAPKQRVGFQQPSANFNVVHAISPLLKIGVGPYYSRYKTDDDSTKINAYGANIDLRYTSSKISKSTLSVNVEKDDIERAGSAKDSVTAWGLQWTGTTKQRVGELRYSIGRFLQASNIGTRTKSDQFRVEYKRKLNPRLEFESAVRGRRERAIQNSDSGNDRDRVNLEISMRSLLTQSLYVSGGYRFAWQDLESAAGSADNHGIFIALGYRGLEPY
ncbi:MAG: hypothetical protein ABI885_04030 [Gammaproteobacteria bacterium]